MSKEKNFKICDNKGFHMTFKNGYTISVQFGRGNYCENHVTLLNMNEYGKTSMASNDAEIAIWDNNGKYCTDEFLHNNDSVQGYMTSDEVALLIFRVANKKVE